MSVTLEHDHWIARLLQAHQVHPDFEYLETGPHTRLGEFLPPDGEGWVANPFPEEERVINDGHHDNYGISDRGLPYTRWMRFKGVNTSYFDLHPLMDAHEICPTQEYKTVRVNFEQFESPLRYPMGSNPRYAIEALATYFVEQHCPGWRLNTDHLGDKGWVLTGEGLTVHVRKMKDGVGDVLAEEAADA